MTTVTPTLADVLAEVRALKRAVGQPEPRLLSQADAAAYVGLGTTKFTELLAAGEVPAGRKVPGRAKDGRAVARLMWRRADLDRWLDRLPPGEAGRRQSK